MVEITVQVPDSLAERLRPASPWLATLLELSLIGFKTPAAQTTSEIIAFLSRGPSPADVIAHKVSARAQERTRRLLALNQAGLLSADEQDKLDELGQLEHMMIMLKALAHEQMTGKGNGR